MGVHNDLPSMSREAIEEYLAIAHHCVTTNKSDGGLYGYPAALLLFSVVDALSNYARHPKHSFGAMKSILPKLSDRQIRQLAQWYRHLLSHQAVIMPGTIMSPEAIGDPIEMNNDGEPTLIRVKPLYEAIKVAWDTLDKTTIKPEIIPQQAPKTPITVASPIPAPSGVQLRTPRRR